MDEFRDYADLYDLDFGDRQEDLFMYRQFCSRCGSPILELGCGTGRLLVPLARDGYHLTGVDVSPAMLERARNKIAAAGLVSRVSLFEQDMRTMAVDGQFALAFVAANSFMHLLTADDQLAALHRIREHLRPGGLLLLDLFNPDLGRLLEPPGQVVFDKVMTDPVSGRRLMRFHSQSVDLGQQTIHATWTVDELDDQGHVRRILFPFSIRYLFRGELELLLRHAELEIEALYGSYEMEDFYGDSERMIAVARRPASA